MLQRTPWDVTELPANDAIGQGTPHPPRAAHPPHVLAASRMFMATMGSMARLVRACSDESVSVALAGTLDPMELALMRTIDRITPHQG